VRHRHPSLLTWSLALAIAVCACLAQAQTTVLPSPASSSLDRLAQAGSPLSAPPPTWDAYAPQASQVFPTTAPQITPAQGTAGSPSMFPPGYPQQNSTFQQTMRLYQGARGSWAYLFGNGQGTNVGVNELDTTATFAVPFFHNSPVNLNHAPLLVTPGFGLQLWDGPQTTSTMLADLPPNTYDVFIDGAWNPQITPLFGAELGLRVGIFTN